MTHRFTQRTLEYLIRGLEAASDEDALTVLGKIYGLYHAPWVEDALRSLRAEDADPIRPKLLKELETLDFIVKVLYPEA